MSTDQALRVFYDDLCPLCSKEINHYRKLVHHLAVDWVEISTSAEVIETFGLTREQLLKRLHVITPEGEVVSGARAFTLIWQALRFYRVLGVIVTRLRLIGLIDRLYEPYADSRYKKRMSCHSDSNEDSGR